MRSACWALAFAGAAAATLAPRIAPAAVMDLPEAHEQWSSFIFRDRHGFRFRAMVVEPQQDATVALALDRYPSGCDRLYVTMLITLPAPAARSMAVMDDAGLVRVDTLRVRPIRFNSAAREGGLLIVAEIVKILGSGDFERELRRGRVVRFKLGAERRTYYVHFPLAGFTAATRRTLALCRASDRILGTPSVAPAPAPRGDGDRDFFPE